MDGGKNFSGIVVGIEYLDGFNSPLLYVHGDVEGSEGDFYVLVDEKELDNYLRLGIGQRIEGVGEEISRNPLVIRKLVVRS